MSTLPFERPVYLDVKPDAVFGMLHRPAIEPQATAVLIAPAWGWSAVAAHRSVRAWAQHLANAGHVTLRFDFPASGDSAGAPGDAARLDAWVGALTAAADWLRAESGCARIAVLGLGLGGLVAGKAVAGDAHIDDLVLWAAPVRGRAFVREQRAFSELQTSRLTLSGELEASELPEGWLEAGGFVLTAETIDALHEVDLRALEPVGLQRALLLDRDGASVDERLRAHFEQTGVDVTTGAGEGWEAMVFHPESPAPPEDVFERVTSWLAQAPEAAAAPAFFPPVAADEIVLDLDGASVRESSLTVQTPAGQLVGVLAEPVATNAGVCAVFLNAGAVRRIGPNRIWAEAARRWAARGVSTLRIDFEGIGDADGDADRYRDVRAFYAPELVDQVRVVLDALEVRGLTQPVLLAGLCSGGYWAFQAAVRDERIRAAVVVNSAALVWDDELVTRRDGRKIARLHQLVWWRKLLRGDVNVARIRAVAGAYVRAAIQRRLQPARGAEDSRVETSIDRGLDRLRDAGKRLVLAFSGDEALHAELQQDGIIARLERWPNVELVTLPGRDHTLRPISAQRAVHDFLDRELTREIDRARGRDGQAAEARGRPPPPWAPPPTSSSARESGPRTDAVLVPAPRAPASRSRHVI